MLLVDDSFGNLGMIGNCDAVLSHTTAPWVMLADPDDVYLPGKISETFKAMRTAEQSLPEGTPIAVCTDANVVDGALRPIVPSYWHWSRQDSKMLDVFHRMIVESPALNSTMMVNRTLLDLALPTAGARYPDWWLALVACAFGRVVGLPKSTILYRRHSENDTLEPLTATLPSAVRRFKDARARVAKLVSEYAQQAAAFNERYGGKLSESERSALQAAKDILSQGFWARRMIVIRHKLWFASSLKNIGLLLLL